MPSFAELYESLMRSSFALSGRVEIANEPSKLRACLFVSAAQLLNIFTFIFVYEAFPKQNFLPTQVALYVLPACVFIANLIYAHSKGPFDKQYSSKEGWRAARPALGYMVISIALFVMSASLLYSTPHKAG